MTAIAPVPTNHPRLTLATEWENTTDVRITVAGDLDASNAADLPEYVFRRAANSRRLTVDLTGVDFLSTAGFSELCAIHQRCLNADVAWTLLGNALVLRVLDICDPHKTLPVNAA